MDNVGKTEPALNSTSGRKYSLKERVKFKFVRVKELESQVKGQVRSRQAVGLAAPGLQ